MLYISRRIGDPHTYYGDHSQDGFYVVDTDDNTEEYISADALSYIVLAKGLRISGASVVDQKLAVVVPYQPIDTLTAEQTKLRFVYDINVVVNNGTLVGIDWNSDILKAPVRVRVSDFATSLGDSILLNRARVESDIPKLVLVFDDKIKSIQVESLRGSFVDFSFIYMIHGVAVDVSEVKSEGLAKTIYDSVCMYWQYRKNALIDSDTERYMRLWH